MSEQMAETDAMPERCGTHCGEDMPGVTIHCRENCCHGRPESQGGQSDA